VHQLGNGVDTDAFRPAAPADAARSKWELGLEERPIVLFVGRLSPEKDVEGLLRAWTLTYRSMPDEWALVIVGDGPSRPGLEDAVAVSGSASRIRMVGAQSNIEAWMAAADIYVSSSLFEGLSNTLLEAMATGLPVVVTRVSGVTDLVEDTGAGLVVDIQNEMGLAAALIHLAQDPDQRRVMGQKARLAIERTYALGVVAGRHETLYRRLIAERRI
jgi:glycosyltransferase involved in cell wall biosynthesis